MTDLYRILAAVAFGVSVYPLARRVLAPAPRRKARRSVRRETPASTHDPTSWLASLRVRLDRAGLERTSVAAYLSALGLAALAVFLVAYPFVGYNPVAAAFLSLLGPMAANSLLDRAAQRRWEVYKSQISAFIESFGYLLPLCGSVYSTLVEYARRAEEPIASDIRDIVSRFSAGEASISALLREWADRTGNFHLRLLADAVAVHEDTGGPVEDVIRQIHAAMRDEEVLNAERQAETAGQGLVVTFVASASMVIYAGLRWLAPELVAPLHTTGLGRMVMALVCLNQLLVVLYIRRMSANLRATSS